jgi:hypothetical protein
MLFEVEDEDANRVSLKKLAPSDPRTEGGQTWKSRGRGRCVGKHVRDELSECY